MSIWYLALVKLILILLNTSIYSAALITIVISVAELTDVFKRININITYAILFQDFLFTKSFSFYLANYTKYIINNTIELNNNMHNGNTLCCKFTKILEFCFHIYFKTTILKKTQTNSGLNSQCMMSNKRSIILKQTSS